MGVTVGALVGKDFFRDFFQGLEKFGQWLYDAGTRCPIRGHRKRTEIHIESGGRTRT